MNGAHLHLVLTHIPIVGIGFGIVLLAVALLKKSRELQQVSFGMLVLLALLTLPVYFTGEPAEELVEELPGISEGTIERHAEAAEVALVAAIILGATAAGAFLFSWRAKPLPQVVSLSVLLLALGVGGALAWTANLGGQIRHTEIRTLTTVTPRQREKGDRWEHNRLKSERHLEEDERDDNS